MYAHGLAQEWCLTEFDSLNISEKSSVYFDEADVFNKSNTDHRPHEAFEPWQLPKPIDSS